MAPGIVKHRPMPVGDDQRLAVIIWVMQGVNEKTPVGLDEFSGAVHVGSFSPIPPSTHSDGG